MKSIFPIALGLGLLLAAPAAAQSHLLVISGLAGSPEHEASFHEWSASMVDAATKRFGVPANRVTWLAEKPERDRGRISAASNKANIDAAISRIAQAAGPADRVLVLLIGHGASDAQGARINLPGPDLNARELATMLDRFRTQPVVVVNAASASGDFQEPLAGRNRAIITATKSGLEQNETVFGRFFTHAYAQEGADVDKDGKVSVLEAYEYANTEVERFYTSDNRLQTEHSVLGGNREVARSFVLGGGGGATTAAAASSPEIRALIEQRQALEGQVQALTARKAEMTDAAYQAELERLLLQLARTNREIREKGGTE